MSRSVILEIGIKPILSVIGFLFLSIFLLHNCTLRQHKNTAGLDQQEPGSLPSPYPDRIVVSWEKTPATSFSVNWRTDSTIKEPKALIALATPSPEFHRKADTLSRIVSTEKVKTHKDSNITSYYHSVTFEGLKPDTLYAYKVGSEKHWSEWIHMRTASRKNKPFSFLYVGDVQNGIFSHGSRAIREAYSEKPDARFIIHAGDLVNVKNRNIEWARWNRAGGWIQSSLANVPVPGNHEYLNYSKEDPQPKLSRYWNPQFTLPENGPDRLKETAYYIDYQGLRIIALNSNVKIDQQTKWLKNTLEATKQRWIVVTHHHPIYSSGQGRNNPEIREKWQPLYERYNVDLVLQGHDHTYARGQTQNVTSGLNTRHPESGTVYVNSVSGSKMYDLKENSWKDFNANLQRSAENTQLFQVIHVSPDTLKYRAYTVTGQLYDAFDLLQQEGVENTRMVDRKPNTKPRTHSNTIPRSK